MKKRILISLFIAFAFYSCNNDDPDNIRYLDNKLIEGKWYGVYGRDSIIYTFKDNKAYHQMYAYISGMDELKDEGLDELGKYFLTDSLIFLPERSSAHQFIYRLRNDSLYLRNPKNVPELWLGYKKLKE